MKNRGMVDVGVKKNTKRLARAAAFVRLNKEIAERIKNNNMPKGSVLENARIAGILAAKNTAGLIPLCHNIELEYVEVNFKFANGGIAIESLVRATGKTGVEMEAIIASTIAAVTIYDMCKMFTKSIEIQNIYLIEKRGGKSGIYIRRNR
ncbi:MAG: cyclic pyranopterin monophosphate synthase MoaC [Candidatus Omnitrophota bacterium]|nr:cyclic pyranopterin monophosphate synthase MoaC [Candidatus Omnitrophota bacterium]